MAIRAVVPGHYLSNTASSLESIKYTADYIKAFDAETARAKDSSALVTAMKSQYPTVEGAAILDMSAKVAKGEMKW